MAPKNKWMGLALAAGVTALLAVNTTSPLFAEQETAKPAPSVQAAVEPAADEGAGAGAPTAESAQAYIEKANAELLKLKDLPEGSPEAQAAILQAYKLIAHGFHQYPRDPSMTVAYATMKPVQLFRSLGWRIGGFLIHSPLDFRRYKNTVRRTYELWKLTDNRAGTHWIRWFTERPADAAFDTENDKFANSKEYPLFPNGEKLQQWLVADVFPEMENVAQALENNVVKKGEDFSFQWDLRSGFSNWLLGNAAGSMVPADESPVKRIGRTEGMLLASGYRAYIGWTKIFCAYNFNSFFKVRSRFNEGRAFTELAELVRHFTLPDLFKLWHKNDSRQLLDGAHFVKSSQADLLTSLQILEDVNNSQFAKGDENPAGRWFDYNVMRPWSGRIANCVNEMRALLTGAVELEDSWSGKRTTVNLAGWFENPPADLAMFLPTKVTSSDKVNKYTPFFQRAEIRNAMSKEFGVDLRHLLKPVQNVDLLDFNVRPEMQPTNDPGEFRDYTMGGLFPGAKDRDGLLRGVYTMVNSRSWPLSSNLPWTLVFGSIFWTN